MEKHFCILIIDDEADLRETLREHLQKAFPAVKVSEAKDGAEGMERILHQKFDLVITDLKMPKLSGGHILRDSESLPDSMRPRHLMVVSGELHPQLSPLIPEQSRKRYEFFTKPIPWKLLLESIAAKIAE